MTKQSQSTSQTSDTSKTSNETDSAVRISSTIGPQQWNYLLDTTPAATPFHRYEFLEVVAEHADATLHTLVGIHEGSPISLFPVFEKQYGPLTAAFSPAPNLKLRYLGPVILQPEAVSRTELERLTWNCIDAAISYLDDQFDPNYVLVRTSPSFADPRPFSWQNFELYPQYSYEVDLTPDRETLLNQFSSDARRNIRNKSDSCTITEGGEDTIVDIIEQVTKRHEEQNEPYHVSAEFVIDLYNSLPDGIVRPITVRVDNQFAGGMITLETDTTIYRWQGGATPDVDEPVNELLDWHIMQTARDRDIRRYDLVGANNPRISRYKSKFSPDLVTFHSATRTSRSIGLITRLYQRFR